MSIVVFHLHNTAPEDQTPSWQPQCRAYEDHAMSQALADCQQLRADPRNAHVCIPSEMREMVGGLPLLWRTATHLMAMSMTGARLDAQVRCAGTDKKHSCYRLQDKDFRYFCI